MDPNPEKRPEEPPPLSPLAQRASRWRSLVLTARGLPLLFGLVAIGVIVKLQFFRDDKAARCPTDSKEVSELLVLTCQDEYLRGRDPKVGIFLADQLRQNMRFAEAKKLASELQDDPAVRADALVTLGKIARRESKLEEAVRLLNQAAELHANRSEWRNAARALMNAGYALDELQRYVAAVAARERAVHFAELARDNETLRDLHIGSANALASLGNGPAALAELRLAAPEGTAPRAVDLAFEADLHQRIGNHALAVKGFTKALATGKLTPVLTFQSHLNLAVSLAEMGDLRTAEQHLLSAKAVDTEGQWTSSISSIEALLAWRRGDLARADELLATSIGKVEEDEKDDKADLLEDRAQLAAERQEWVAAAQYAEESLRLVNEIRDEQPPLLFRSWITEQYRRSYELLFLALAHTNRAEDALVVLDAWQGQGAIDTFTPLGSNNPGEKSVDSLAKLVSVRDALRATSLGSNHSREALREKIAGKDLVAIVVVTLQQRAPGSDADKDEVWRLSSIAGRLQLDRLGQYSLLAPRFDRFMSEPLASREEAAALGALLIPPALAVRTDRVLHVLLDSRLQALPVAALRIGAQPLVALRPPLHILRPSEVECAPPLGTPSQVNVLADAGGDLKGASAEASSVAGYFKVPSLTKAQATLAALRRPAQVAHVGVHSSTGGRSKHRSDLDGVKPELGFAPNDAVLHMHDGDEHALEIATRGKAPALVVLSSCVSGISAGGTYSLASAYLVGGSSQVIATLRKIQDLAPSDDRTSAGLATRFFKRGGVDDPVRVLAAVQAELAGTDDPQWPQFAIYGRETCKVSRLPHK